MPKPLKWGVLGAGTRILSKDIHNYILCVVRIFMKQTLLIQIPNFVFTNSYKFYSTRPISLFLQKIGRQKKWKKKLEFVVGYDEQQQKTQFLLTLHADTMNDDIDQNVLSKPAKFIDLLFTYIILASTLFISHRFNILGHGDWALAHMPGAGLDSRSSCGGVSGGVYMHWQTLSGHFRSVAPQLWVVFPRFRTSRQGR